ncbi:MAG: DUF3572 domain-containing protein [Beijerinckiaceae bacterium]
MKFKTETKGHSADAEMLGIHALVWLAADGERLERFLSLTGLAPESIREAASQPGFLGAVLDHLLGNETLLTEFATAEGLDPASLAAARARLPGAWQSSDFG